ncbi:MAG: GDSL-type esterase/lipase family protein [Planctomycetota bacterium]
MSRRRGLPTWLGRAAVLAILTALLLEAVLQAGAAVVWFTHRQNPTATGADHTSILCVGDSFTFGFGKTTDSGSYPAQLEQQLAQQGFDGIRVLNHGWPGKSSRDVLAQLDADLTELRPRIAYVLCGANDHWGRPELLELETSDRDPATPPVGGFRLEWRTRRFAAWVIGKLRRASKPFDAHRAVAERIARQRRSWRAAPDTVRGTALVAGLVDVDDEALCREIIAEVLEQHPDSGPAHAHAAWRYCMLGDVTSAQRTTARAVNLLPAAHPLRGKLLRTQALLLARHDPTAALGAADAAAAANGGAGLDREAVFQIMVELIPPGVLQVYEAHLRQAVERCRAVGTEAVLLSYPNAAPRLERSIRRVATTTGSDWIDMAARFAARIDGQPRDQFFIPDGHCNDRGYGVMAAIVADDAAARLAR